MAVDRTVKPFTVYQRKGLCYQDGYGFRGRCDWGMGDLPGPYAEGDLLFIPEDRTHDRLHGMGWGYFVVAAGFSIDEGDAWYYRVSNAKHSTSDRLHVAWTDRSTWDHDQNWMDGWQLIESSDPEGLAARNRLLADGWSFTDPNVCPMCGHRLR